VTMFSLAGSTAVVTGAASGIGKATATRLRKAGADVVVVDVDAEGGERAAAAIDGHFVRADVARVDEADEAMRAAVERTGRLDIVVNNAGIALELAAIADTSEEHFRRHMDVNALGVLNGIKAAAPLMSDAGAIVNTASLLGVMALPGYASYAASKFAIVGLTKVAAVELGPRGIRVNAICPTTVDTPMLDSFPAAQQEAAVLSLTSTLGRIVDAEHVAALVHFLVADDCPVISGQAVMIDCGITSGVSAQLWDSQERRA
jgi:NAD(P)-dependent dehydrogenase (short-subunit alcohol dehydrogenase family)